MKSPLIIRPARPPLIIGLSACGQKAETSVAPESAASGAAASALPANAVQTLESSDSKIRITIPGGHFENIIDKPTSAPRASPKASSPCLSATAPAASPFMPPIWARPKRRQNLFRQPEKRTQQRRRLGPCASGRRHRQPHELPLQPSRWLRRALCWKPASPFMTTPIFISAAPTAAARRKPHWPPRSKKST